MERRLKQINEVINQGPYNDSWDSLSDIKVPEWYQKAKFGIFIHWGVYSVPAYSNEWYPRGMYMQGSKEYKHHVETYGPHAKFGYKDFIPMFKAEKFDADEWASIMMASKCIGAIFQDGTRPRWGRKEILSVN